MWESRMRCDDEWWRECDEENEMKRGVKMLKSSEEVVGVGWWGWRCREIGYYPKLGAHYNDILAHYNEILAHHKHKYNDILTTIIMIFYPYYNEILTIYYKPYYNKFWFSLYMFYYIWPSIID